MARVRAAPMVSPPVPVKPLPVPECTDARTLAATPRPPVTGATVPPRETPWTAGELPNGDQPSWSAAMLCEPRSAGTAAGLVGEGKFGGEAGMVPLNAVLWPETDQPGKVLRVSVTMIGVVLAVAW